MMINWEWFLDQNLNTRRYYDMEDFYKGQGRATPEGPFSARNWDFATLSGYLYSNGAIWPDLNKPEISTLFRDYIFPNYWNSAVAYSDDLDLDEMTADQFKEIFEEFVGHLVVWVRQTAPAYIKEIELYTNIENNLMAQIGNSTTTTFNDTPQSAGEYGDDKHTTTISETVNNSDVATPIERLKEIRDNIRNVYEKWSKEFRKFVINY